MPPPYNVTTSISGNGLLILGVYTVLLGMGDARFHEPQADEPDAAQACLYHHLLTVAVLELWHKLWANTVLRLAPLS